MMLGFAGMAAAEDHHHVVDQPWRLPAGMDSSQAPTAEDWPEWVSQEFMRLNRMWK